MMQNKIGKRDIYFKRTGKRIERTVYIASDGSRYIKYLGHIIHVEHICGGEYLTTDW